VHNHQMPQPPVTDEISAALARFFHGGDGPSHSQLSTAFSSTGYKSDDPYDLKAQAPNKEVRVLTVMAAARRRPDRARQLVEAILVDLRVGGRFHQPADPERRRLIVAAQQAFSRGGWNLSDDGVLSVQGQLDLSTGGRDALDEQLDRLRKATDDPAQLIGTAKDLLEAVAKFTLEEVGFTYPPGASFGHLWHLARERLGLLPTQVDTNLPGGAQIKKILGSAWVIAEQINELRGIQGTGHGRTLPTGVTAEVALLVVREACGVAELCLTTLDRQLGKP
jgi:hypothetical protein